MKINKYHIQELSEDYIDLYYREETDEIKNLIHYVNSRNVFYGKTEKGRIRVLPHEIYYIETVDKKTFAYLEKEVVQIAYNMAKQRLHIKMVSRSGGMAYRNKESKWYLSWIRHFIVMDENTPIGFCQYYDCFYANDMEDWYDVAQKNNTFSIDYLIGNEEYLGKGYGKAIVGLLTETIKEKEQAKQIIVQPDKENIPSNKALLANGYIFDENKNYYYKLLD